MPGLGCEGEGSGGATPEILGTWVRSKVYVAYDGADPVTDKWTLTFRPDMTFTMSHVNEQIVAYAHQITTTSREGTYAGGTDGTVQLSGGWVENAADVTTLDGLAAIIMSFTQDTMYTLNETGDVMFLGPEFNRDSVYSLPGNSYTILFSDGASSYVRESSLELKDNAGTVLEKRVESYAYTILDQDNCNVAYSFDNYLDNLFDIQSFSSEGSGTGIDCEYVFAEDQSVKDLDGNQMNVTTIVFKYYIPDPEGGDDVQTIDSFAALPDGTLISYPENKQDDVFFVNAFRKVAD